MGGEKEKKKSVIEVDDFDRNLSKYLDVKGILGQFKVAKNCTGGQSFRCT